MAADNRSIETPSTSRPLLTLRALEPADSDELRRIHATPEVARWWDAPSEDFPSADEPGVTQLTIDVDGSVAGMVQFYEEPDPKYRHASIDVFLDPALHGRGLGSEVVRRVVRHLLEDRGHHRITLDPALANVAAIRCYERVGFKRVGVLRRYERGARRTLARRPIDGTAGAREMTDCDRKLTWRPGRHRDRRGGYMLALGYPADRPLVPLTKINRRPFDEVIHRGRC